MKALFLTLILGLNANALMSQENSIQFSYDQAGNLIERKLQALFMGRLAPFQKDTTQADSLLYSIYPNPSNDLLNIERIARLDEKVEGISTCQLLTINGQVVGTGTELKEYATMNVSHLASGIYFLVIMNEKKEKNIYKVIISN